MNEASKRISYLLGQDALEKLQQSCVMIVGIGGVGGYAAESLARSFVGKLILVDMDKVSYSNLNRQIIATLDTIDRQKVEVMKERIHSINPQCEVITYNKFYDKNEIAIFEHKIDFVVDAIDVLSSKMDLIEACSERKIPMISSLGMGNRLDPSQVILTTLDKTNYDPLARALRNIVKKRAFKKKIPVVFSKEIPIKQTIIENSEGKTRKEVLPPSSSAFVPSSAGLLCGYYVVDKLVKNVKIEEV